MNEIIIPVFITRKFIQEHRDYIFLFGHDVQGKGCFGQSWESFGEPNSFPIPTCWKMCRNSMYFSDTQYDEVKKLIDEAISRIPKEKSPIIPFPKIGMGHSRMMEFSPKTFSYMRKEIDEIKYLNIKINYYA